jgi:Sulfotransferase family
MIARQLAGTTMNNSRTTQFRRNVLLETLLSQLNNDLRPAEAELFRRYGDKPMPYPLILVMGPLRSGMTLFTQWLANTGLVAYPTNLLSRFYQAPIIGAKVQLLLTDPRYNFRDELGEFAQQAEYKSENGKTRGVLAPNEFWYFWRRFLAEPERDVWTDDELRQSLDAQTMESELSGMMDVFQKPFAAKGMLFNYNIPFLDAIFKKAVFIQFKRDPITNVASILEARKRQLGSENEWYSFKIPEYPQLKGLEPIAQSAGQLHYINKAVAQGMATVDESRKLVVQYEDFCQNPRLIFTQLVEKLKINASGYCGPAQFRLSRDSDSSGREAIEKALAGFAGK